MNSFIISLVVSSVGSQLKILSMSWYKSIKPFQNNLKLVIKKYLCSGNDPLPGVEYSSNDQVFSGIMTKYIYY